MSIAALFVEKDGPYANLPGVEVWDKERDARLYDGPYPVVAHPPCERWGRYWSGGPSAKTRRALGDDMGCFEAALKAVRKFGGVLEHPEASHAWRAHNILSPPKSGGWLIADAYGFTCCVEQGHYGHRARKATWLYVCGVRVDDLPNLIWGIAPNKVRLDEGYHSKEERQRAIKTGICQRLSKRQRILTPQPFRDLLIEMARKSYLSGT